MINVNGVSRMKRWIVLLIIIVGLLSVSFTSIYYKNSSKITQKTYKGTYQINDSASIESATQKEYLAVELADDQSKGEFVLYNSQNEILKSGFCQVDDEYVVLRTDNSTMILLCTSDKYYLIEDDLQPKSLDKIDSNPIIP